MKEKYRLTIEEVLIQKGRYVGPTMGVSMRPMLKSGRDTIVVEAKNGRLKPKDVALYRSGEKYVLHRVLSVTEAGYIIRGDNCYVDEIVPEEAVFGVLTEFFRKNKHYLCTDERYLRYVDKRLKRYKLRRFFVAVKRKLVAGLKKPFKLLLKRKKMEK